MSSLIEKFKEQARTVAEKSGINAYIIYAGLITLVTMLVLEKIDGKLVTLSVGVILPAIFSLKALKSEDKDDDKQWLTYWTVFSLFVLFETFLFENIIYIIGKENYYFIFKLVFLIWLFLPNFQGAAFIYDKFIFKVFKSAEKDIDAFADKTIKKVTGKKQS
jgi:receptor expression-enhancing protein 5/6